MKKLVLLAIIQLLVGCTTVGKPYSPPPPTPQGMAIVHFVRSSVGYGNFWSTVFSINDIKVVSLYDKGYSWIYLAPGSYKFSAGAGMNTDYVKFNMPIEQGREYFLEYHQVRVSATVVRDELRAVDPAVGKGLIEKYSYKESEKVDIPMVAKD